MRWVETEMRDVNQPRMKELLLTMPNIVKTEGLLHCWDGLGHINEIEENSMVQLKDPQI